jgi:hypothetical protein
MSHECVCKIVAMPGPTLLLSCRAEPAGAAAGVAYMMTLILSSPAVDPSTLAPKVRHG